jgi:hypothetical protein
MTLPKSRPVTFQKVKYRFSVKEIRTPGHQDSDENQITIQEDCERPGNVLQFRGECGIPITPRLIREAISIGLQQGWDPSARGAAFKLEPSEVLQIMWTVLHD